MRLAALGSGGAWLVLSLLAPFAWGRGGRDRGTPLKQQWPWYRTGEELRGELSALSGDCPRAEVGLSQVSRINSAGSAGTEVTLDVLRIRRGNVQPRARALLVFGEHARELITGEAALGLAQALCGKGSHADDASRALDEGVEFVLVPNANPLSRKLVEDGFYCKRTNEDGVDLNRNWSDEHRDGSLPAGDEMYPGTGAFSEPETLLLREIVDKEQPDVYVSVHSGAYLLGMPFGFSSGKRLRGQDSERMLAALAPISDRYCGGACPYGNLAELIDYENPGCDIDYVYGHLHTPYVFTWEIFVGEAFRGRYVEEAHARRSAAPPLLAQLRKRSLRGRRGGRRLAAASAGRLEAEEPEADQDVASCMEQFNPQTPGETAAVVETWTGAFLDLARRAAAGRAQRGVDLMSP